jgi:hypothetical protein
MTTIALLSRRRRAHSPHWPVTAGDFDVTVNHHVMRFCCTVDLAVAVAMTRGAGPDANDD